MGVNLTLTKGYNLFNLFRKVTKSVSNVLPLSHFFIFIYIKEIKKQVMLYVILTHPQDCMSFQPCDGLFSFGSDQNGEAPACEAKQGGAEFC